MIVAIGENREIGLAGDMLWRISSDLQRFKKITMGNPIIMGRKTFESLPKKPLPGRHHIVLTRDQEYTFEGIQVCHSVEEVLSLDFSGKEPFIIGGGEIYKAFLAHCNKLYLTQIHANAAHADAYFPVLEAKEWNVDEEIFCGEEGDNPAYTYRLLLKKQDVN